MGHGRETKGHLSTVEDGDKVIKGVHEGINIFSTIDLLTVSICAFIDGTGHSSNCLFP